MPPAIGMIIGLAGGFTAGLSLRAIDPALLASAGAIAEPVGTLWFNALRMTVLPIVVAQLILGVNASPDSRALGVLGGRTVAWMLGLLAFSSAAAAIAGPWMLAGVAADAPPAGATPVAALSAGDWISGLLPANVFEAAAKGQLLALISFSILFGTAMRGVEERKRQAVLVLLEAVSDAMMRVVGWALWVAPAGVFGLALTMVWRLGGNAVAAFAYYIVTFCLLLVALWLLLYPLAIWRGGYRLGEWASAIAPVQAVAFTSRSSLAALPAMLAAASGRLRMPVETRGFVLPLAVTMMRYTAPAGQVYGALFIARLYGIELSGVQLAFMVPASVVLSFGAPGIPSSGLMVALPLYLQFGLPAEGLAVLIAADAIPDMFKTLANATAHMTVAGAVSADSTS